MENVVFVEYRTRNSPRHLYNKAGDWRPRYVIWPEYNGYPKRALERQRGRRLDKITDALWATVIAESVRDFCNKHNLAKIVFRRVRPEVMPLGGRLTRALKTFAPDWVEESTGPHRLTPEYVMERERGLNDEVVYLLSEDSAKQLNVKSIAENRILDRATLLPNGRAILTLGTDDAVAEICFEEPVVGENPDEAAFMEILKKACERNQHKLERTEQHFIHDWVVANLRLSDDRSEYEF